MAKLNCSVNLVPRSNKLVIATSCVGGSLDPKSNQLSCITKHEPIQQFIITLVDNYVIKKRVNMLFDSKLNPYNTQTYLAPFKELAGITDDTLECELLIKDRQSGKRMLGQSCVLSSLSEYGGQVYLAMTQLFNSKDKQGFCTQQGTELFRAEGKLIFISCFFFFTST